MGKNKYKKILCVRHYSTRKPSIKHEGWCFYNDFIYLEDDLENYLIYKYIETRKNDNINIVEEQKKYFVFYDINTNEQVNSLIFFKVKEEYYFYSYKKKELYIIYLVCFLEESDVLLNKDDYHFTIYYFLPVEIEDYFRSTKKASSIMMQIYYPLEVQSYLLLSKKKFINYTYFFWFRNECINYKKEKKKKFYCTTLFFTWIMHIEKQQFTNEYNYKESSFIPTVAYLQHTPNNLKILQNNAFAINHYFVSTFFFKDKTNDAFNIDDVYVIISLFTINRENTFESSSKLYNEIINLKPLKYCTKSITIDPRSCVITYRDFMKLNIKEPYIYYKDVSNFNIPEIKKLLDILYKSHLLQYTDKNNTYWDLYNIHIKAFDNPTSYLNSSSIKKTLTTICYVYFNENNIIRVDLNKTNLSIKKNKKVKKKNILLSYYKYIILLPIILLLILFFIFCIYKIEYYIKINRSINTIIKKWTFELFYIVWKLFTNILFFLIYYILSKLICIINVIFFFIRLNFYKSMCYLLKIWWVLFFFLFGFYPITVLLFLIFCLELYHLLNKLLRFKIYKENKHRLVFKILCVFNRLIVSKKYDVQQKIFNVYMKDLITLIDQKSKKLQFNIYTFCSTFLFITMISFYMLFVI